MAYHNLYLHRSCVLLDEVDLDYYPSTAFLTSSRNSEGPLAWPVGGFSPS